MHLQVLRYGYNFVTSGRLVVSQIFRKKEFFLGTEKASKNWGSRFILFCFEPCERMCEKGANLYENWKRLG